MRPNVGRIDVDATELERREARSGPPGTAAAFGAARDDDGLVGREAARRLVGEEDARPADELHAEGDAAPLAAGARRDVRTLAVAEAEPRHGQNTMIHWSSPGNSILMEVWP